MEYVMKMMCIALLVILHELNSKDVVFWEKHDEKMEMMPSQQEPDWACCAGCPFRENIGSESESEGNSSSSSWLSVSLVLTVLLSLSSPDTICCCLELDAGRCFLAPLFCKFLSCIAVDLNFWHVFLFVQILMHMNKLLQKAWRINEHWLPITC